MNKRWGGFPFAPPKLSGLLLLATSLHLSVALVTHSLWLLWGYQPLFRFYFGYEDPIFLICCTIIEFSFAFLAWKQFSPEQPLRRAWLLIMISASCHVIGMTISHWLCLDSDLNPLFALNVSWYKTAAAILRPLGFFIGGPLHIVVLAGGLYLPLRLCRLYGVRAELKKIDWVILCGVLAYTVRVAYVVIHLRIGNGQPIRLSDVMNWTGDPMLCVLLFLAFFLRRSVAQMGWGYVTKCWGAYVAAILGTSLASMAMWAVNFSIVPYPESAFTWYIWPLIYTAYALGPIYQIEAARVAQERLEDFDQSFQNSET